MVSPGKIMADGQAEKFKKPTLFEWTAMEIDRWICLTILLEGKGETDICQDSGLKGMFPFSIPASNLFQISRQ